MADYNPIDCEACGLLEDNAEMISELTMIHNGGQNSELRAMVRTMIETRLKESDDLQKWMNRNGIVPPPVQEEGDGSGDLMY